MRRDQLKRLLFVILLILPSLVDAATYYVATTGSNAFPGTEAQPWLTVQHAADTVAAGDTVRIQPGVYYERVVMTTDGTSGSRIVFQGTLGANGDWLSIIDGSDLVTATWEAAPGLSNVYRAELPYEPYAMTINGAQCASMPDDCSKTIWRIGHDAMYQLNSFAVGEPDEDMAGFTALVTAANADVIPYYIIEEPVKYWDGIEVLFGYHEGYTYLRFRNGDNPNSKTLRISPGPSCQFCDPTIGAFTLDAASYVTVKHLRIRGARNGVLIDNGSSNNVIEYNHITNGQARVRIDNTSAANEVRFNVLRSNHVSGWLPGARTESLTYAPIGRIVNWNLYFVNKFTVGDTSEDDRGIVLWEAGAGNTIHHNEIFEGGLGITLLDAADQTQIYRNIIHNMHSQGLFFNQLNVNVEVFENLLYDNGINIRIQELEYSNHEIYIYRNRLWNPYGEHVFFNTAPTDSTSTIFFYHNSFSGPFRSEIAGSTGGDFVTDISVSTNLTTGVNIIWLNNILGSMWVVGAEKFGVVDSNLMAPDYVLTDNTAYSPKPWGDTFPRFTISSTSQARDTGINLSAAFTVQSRSFSALPGMTAAVDGLPDLGAYEYGSIR